MVFSYLEKLRRKPAEVRRTYALVFTSVITGIVVLIWLVFAYINNLGTRPVDEGRKDGDSSFSLSEVFKQSNEFLNTVNQNTYSDETDDWTQELRQFNDDALFIESTRATSSGFFNEFLESTSTQQ